MYLKVKTSDRGEGWSVYEVDKVHWAQFVEHEWWLLQGRVADYQPGLTLVYPKGEAATSESEAERDRYVDITFCNTAGALQNILTSLPAFLLNGEGKTIERIN